MERQQRNGDRTHGHLRDPPRAGGHASLLNGDRPDQSRSRCRGEQARESLPPSAETILEAEEAVAAGGVWFGFSRRCLADAVVGPWSRLWALRALRTRMRVLPLAQHSSFPAALDGSTHPCHQMKLASPAGGAEGRLLTVRVRTSARPRAPTGSCVYAPVERSLVSLPR